MTISVSSWIVGAFMVGLVVPLVIAALAGGYILGTFVWGRFAKTVLGVHVRHFFSRIAPPKFFDGVDPGDRSLVRNIILDEIKKNGRVQAMLKEAARG